MASCMQVLVVPLPSAESHTFVMVKVVQEMAARGHQVLVRMPSCPIVLSIRIMSWTSCLPLCYAELLGDSTACELQEPLMHCSGCREQSCLESGALQCAPSAFPVGGQQTGPADGSPAACCMMSRSALCCLQMVIPESDLSTLEKVDASAFNVTTYKAAYTKQVRHSAF